MFDGGVIALLKTDHPRMSIVCVVKQLQLGTLSTKLSKMHLVQFITKDKTVNTLSYIWKKQIEIKLKYQQQGLFKSFLSGEQVRLYSGLKEYYTNVKLAQNAIGLIHQKDETVNTPIYIWEESS